MAMPTPASANLHFPVNRGAFTTGAPREGDEAGVVLWRDLRLRFLDITRDQSVHLCGREQSITQHDFNPAGVWTMMTEQHEDPEVAL